MQAPPPGRPSDPGARASDPHAVDQINNAQDLASLVFAHYQTASGDYFGGGGRPIGIYPVANVRNLCLVALSGTQPFMRQATGLLEDVSSAFGQNDSYQQRVVEIFASGAAARACPRGSNLILAGHSLGGMEAEKLAVDQRLRDAGYTPTIVITFGSPIVAAEAQNVRYRRFSAIGDSIPYSAHGLELVGAWVSYVSPDPAQRYVDDRPDGERLDAMMAAIALRRMAWTIPAAFAAWMIVNVPPHLTYPRIGDLARFDAFGSEGGGMRLRLDRARSAAFAAPRVLLSSHG